MLPFNAPPPPSPCPHACLVPFSPIPPSLPCPHTEKTGSATGIGNGVRFLPFMIASRTEWNQTGLSSAAPSGSPRTISSGSHSIGVLVLKLNRRAGGRVSYQSLHAPSTFLVETVLLHSSVHYVVDISVTFG
jgi:hypothetical protein